MVTALKKCLAILLLLSTLVPSIMMMMLGDQGVLSAGMPAVGLESGRSIPNRPYYNAVPAHFQDQPHTNAFLYPLPKQYSMTRYVRNQYGKTVSVGGNVAPSSRNVYGGHPLTAGVQNVLSGRALSQDIGQGRYTKLTVAMPEAIYRGFRDNVQEIERPETNRGLLDVEADQSQTAADQTQVLMPGDQASSVVDLSSVRVEISSSGGYPTNRPRQTYLTFIIPGDICSLNQRDRGFVEIGDQTPEVIPYESTYGTLAAPGSAPASVERSYQTATGDNSIAVQSQPLYNNEQVHGTQQVVIPYGNYDTSGGYGPIQEQPTPSDAAPGSFVPPEKRGFSAVRSLEDSNQPVEESKPSMMPPNQPAPSSETQTKEAQVPQTNK